MPVASLRRECGRSWLEAFIDSLRPSLPGVVITPDAEGAVVQSSDASLHDVLTRNLDVAFKVTPLTPTSWQVSWAFLPATWSAARRRHAVTLTAKAARQALGDPLGLSVYSDGDGMHFLVTEPEKHAGFIEAVRRAFGGNPRFIFREADALEMRLTRPRSEFAASSAPPLGLPSNINLGQIGRASCRERV